MLGSHGLLANVEWSGQVGPTFLLLLIVAACGIWISVKYRTNEALKQAVDAWRENAEAHEEKADRLGDEVRDLRVDLASVKAELTELQRRAPDLKALYELNNLAATVNKNNESTLKIIVTQLERLVQSVDTFAQHAAKQT